ncbi:MAG TPA: DegT/DnrJ/EryC1/StrS family aminotransferase [Candidatus Brocadiia bacterium]|nr:DegT/DnrJ/EryC1/StrS family aminotransferase [Candidatus Brocadiia bacterium]
MISDPRIGEPLAVAGGRPVRTAPFPSRTPYDSSELELVRQALASQSLFMLDGPEVGNFERTFADLYGMRHAAASTSGTSAIHLAVGAVNPNPGDEIITSPVTDLGTVIPILMQNAIPIFAEVRPDTFNMDPADVERKITDRTRAIIVVHLFGNAADMDAMLDIARRYNLVLIEDCSQAHVTRYKGRLLGTIGDIGCFSLQGSKHMTTGDGGVTITNDDARAERMLLFRDKGFSRAPWGPRKYEFLAPNYRPTKLMAAVGMAQIGKVRNVVERLISLCRELSRLLEGIDGVLPAAVTEGLEHSAWAYPLRVHSGDAARFGSLLRDEGVPNMPGYIGLPIFMCAECCAGKATFGDSGFPFDSPYNSRKLEYNASMCSITAEALRSLVVLPINENYADADLRDIAVAVAKAAQSG